MNIYNVIILDESGSMSSIYKETLLSMNEVLSGIRRNQEEYSDRNDDYANAADAARALVGCLEIYRREIIHGQIHFG